MKILILSWRGLGHPRSGGAEISTHEHAKGWVRAGNEVTLFTSFFKRGKKTENIDGVQIVRKGGEIFGVQIAAFLWYLFGRHKKFDVVVDQFHGIPFFTPVFVRTKKIAFIHEVTKEVWKLNPWPKPFNLIPFAIGRVFEPVVFRLFYRNIPFMTVSRSTKDDLIEWGVSKDNIEIIHNGFTKVRGNFNKEKINTVVYLGALSKDKGVEDAIKVFSVINSLNSNYQFWIVGKGEKSYFKFLKSKVKVLGISKRTKFWGFVDQKKKFKLLGRSHILVNPSVREGWGLVNIEANSVGLPVVGYNVAGMRDSVVDGKTGLLSKVGDVQKLASDCISLLSNKKKYSKFQKNAATWSKKFDWELSRKKSLSLLDRL